MSPSEVPSVAVKASTLLGVRCEVAGPRGLGRAPPAAGGDGRERSVSDPYRRMIRRMMRRMTPPMPMYMAADVPTDRPSHTLGSGPHTIR
jgi:hypothetical protein